MLLCFVCAFVAPVLCFFVLENSLVVCCAFAVCFVVLVLFYVTVFGLKKNILILCYCVGAFFMSRFGCRVKVVLSRTMFFS